VWVVIALLAVLVSGCGPGPARVGSGPLLPGESAAGGAQVAAVNPTTAPRSLPVQVRIPKIDAQSSLVQLGLNPDGTVQVPPVSQPMQAGWYAGGAAPGETGPAVLLGHVDGNRQAGIFYRLHELAIGDDVYVTRADGVVLHFAVTTKTEVSKDDFPTEAVYGPTSDPELRLITCGGSFNAAAHSYVDNIVVYAKLVGG
jgi:LPXTG-site transpeptidase (sortase) family protein